MVSQNLTSMETLESQFTTQALNIYELGKELFGYNATRFLQKVRKDGGVKAAKSWLNPKDKEKEPTKGFMELVSNGRLDVSLEALVLKEPWNSLFTQDELTVAKARLVKYGYNEVELVDVESVSLIAEEITSTEKFVEGAAKTIQVNTYERNPNARKKCLEYYGAVCCICDFDFGKVYGEKFDDFIHVHHLRPIATIGSTYTFDPIKDLRPVCPNCHAVIHRKNPPYTIKQVERMIKNKIN